jgi:hypothetical protein
MTRYSTAVRLCPHDSWDPVEYIRLSNDANARGNGIIGARVRAPRNAGLR